MHGYKIYLEVISFRYASTTFPKYCEEYDRYEALLSLSYLNIYFPLSDILGMFFIYPWKKLHHAFLTVDPSDGELLFNIIKLFTNFGY